MVQLGGRVFAVLVSTKAVKLPHFETRRFGANEGASCTCSWVTVHDVETKFTLRESWEAQLSANAVGQNQFAQKFKVEKASIAPVRQL